jgi:hypothetical protein
LEALSCSRNKTRGVACEEARKFVKLLGNQHRGAP